jgi:APA family basic amino acid/polyamine antiporter
LTIGLVWLVALVNLFGARSAGGFQFVTTLLKLIPLVAAVVITLVVVFGTRGAALAPLPVHGFSLSAITASASLTLWAMLGFESASLATSQIDRPAITIPRAMLAGAGLAGLIYLIACSGIALLLPADIAANSHAPFADFVGHYWGPGPAAAVALFAAISAIGALNGLTLVVGAIPLSLARAGSLPAWFGVTSASGTPVRAILVGTGLTTVLLLLNAARGLTDLFTFLALMSTSSALFLYFGAVMAAFKLRVGGAVGVAATAFTLWTFWGAGIDATGWSSLLLLAGVPVFLLAKRGLRRTGLRPAP